MSSVEIAELVGKRHDHVIRDIRAMLVQMEVAPVLGQVSEIKDRRGATTEYHLDRYHTEVLITGSKQHKSLLCISKPAPLLDLAVKALPY